jgi:hypothetical protein
MKTTSARPFIAESTSSVEAFGRADTLALLDPTKASAREARRRRQLLPKHMHCNIILKSDNRKSLYYMGKKQWKQIAVISPWKDGDVEAEIKTTKRGAAIMSAMPVELFLKSSAMTKRVFLLVDGLLLF